MQLGGYIEKGVFTLPRLSVQEGRPKIWTPRVRAPTHRQRAAVEGKDEGVMWRVLDVAWSGDDQEMVVFYQRSHRGGAHGDPGHRIRSQ